MTRVSDLSTTHWRQCDLKQGQRKSKGLTDSPVTMFGEVSSSSSLKKCTENEVQLKLHKMFKNH